ncbi:MAG: TetR/AcrR family transcriptional regulator [Leptospiraceae bacterium]|nr:TetR/AcrR family transcriptional regulator [Leptospiraceae bacterium]
MGRRAIEKNRILDPKTRQEWLEQLIPFFMQNGFYRIKMEDITRYLGVSKATLYDHFSSRDELFEMVVDYVLGQIGGNREILDREELTYEERYVYLFGLILQQINGISSRLLEDIKLYFPALWQRIEDFYESWQVDLETFFARGIEEGAFVKAHPALMARMITILLRELMMPDFLISNNMTMQQVFLDFYRLQSQGLFATGGQEDFDKNLEKQLNSIIQKTFDKNKKGYLKVV